VEKYGRIKQVTDDLIWRILFECLITRATQTEYVTPIDCQTKNIFAKAPYVTSYINCLSGSYIV
jgi:hypothetical protein